MKLHRSLAVAALLAAVAVPAVQAQSDGDAAAGKALAQEWCTRCHNIEPDGPSKQFPPSFASIAGFRSPEQIYGKMAFQPIHSGMPQFGQFLDSGQLEDVIAYITSLEEE